MQMVSNSNTLEPVHEQSRNSNIARNVKNEIEDAQTSNCVGKNIIIGKLLNGKTR